MRTSSAKAKGRRLQQYVAAQLLQAFPQLDASDVRSTGMGQPGEDVQLSARAREVIGRFSFECKNQERLSIHAALEQCLRNAAGNEPALVFHKNRSETYVAIRFSCFVRMLAHSGASSTHRARCALRACDALRAELQQLLDGESHSSDGMATAEDGEPAPPSETSSEPGDATANDAQGNGA